MKLMQVQEIQNEASRANPVTTSRRKPFARRSVLLFILYFAVTIVFQSLTGIYHSELGHCSDEPSHVVTALMMRDYLVSGFHENPVRYAENYYIHYPKVAVGMWPPVFHATAAVWMLLFSPTRTSLLLFMALQATLLALTLAFFAARLFGWEWGATLGLLLLCLPEIQWGFSAVMLDICIALLEFWAMWFAVLYFKSERTRWAVLFGLCSAIAMLTKGTANALVLVPGIMLLLTRRFSLLRRRGLYIAGAIVVLLGCPWQLLSWRLYQGTIPIAHVDFPYIWSTFFGYMRIFLHKIGAPFCILALLGLVVECWKLLRARSAPLTDPNYAMSGVISLLLAVVVFHSIVPLPGPETRYMAPATPMVVILVAVGVRWMAERLPQRVPLAARLGGIAGIALIIFAGNTFALPSRPRQGFIEAVDHVLKPEMKHDAILICSDGDGEGAFVAEAALRDIRPGAIILRASKVVSEDPWSHPDRRRPLLNSTAEAEQYLESVPVDSIVVDLTQGGWPEDRTLLLETMNQYPSRWYLLAEIQADAEHHHLLLYRRVGADSDKRPKTIRLRMRFTLGRDLALQP